MLETLYALTSNTKIVKEAMAKGQYDSSTSVLLLNNSVLNELVCFPGALIYLLDLFCNCTHPQVRTQTAELFSKMTSDKLVGPKVSLEKFSEVIFFIYTQFTYMARHTVFCCRCV